MKRIVLLIGISMICALTFGCGAQQDENKNKLENMNAQEILEVLNSQGYPNDAASYYMDKGSTSGYPWSIKGCTSAVEWTITLGNQGEESSGIIEVFNNAANCTARTKDLSSSNSPEQAYFIQVDAVFMQIPFALTLNEVSQFEAALKAMAQGKTPEIFTAETLSMPSLWRGYIETFPTYVYTGIKDANFADRHFELKDAPQNIPEELVTLNFYYDISGEYDKMYDLCGSESMQISATNTEDNFKDGQYTQEYIVRQLSTLPLDEFLDRNSGILEMTKRDVTQNSLTEYTLVRADHTFTISPKMKDQAQLSDGDYTFYYLCGKSQKDSNWKLYEVYWE
jgi:hypothetical protein